MRAYEFRDGDIVEVSPGYRDGRLIRPFRGVVDYRSLPPSRRPGIVDFMWVYVRRTGRFPHRWSGGWYPHQCRLIHRPKPKRILRVPENIVLGEN